MEFVRPAQSSTLRGAIDVFEWDLENLPVSNTIVYVGSSLGGREYAASSVGADTKASFENLPTDGSDVFVRIWYRFNSVWASIDGTFTSAESGNAPAIVQPGSVLDGSTQEFTWDAKGLPVEQAWIYAGTTVGGSEFSSTLVGTEAAVSIDGLPTDGSEVKTRLYFKTVGSWYFTDQLFTAASPAPEPVVVAAVPTRDELVRELQTLAGTTADGDIGPQSRAAFNRNWIGRPESFDPSFASKFTNNEILISWVKRRLNTRSGLGLTVDGNFDLETEQAVKSQLGNGGVVASESFQKLLDPG